MFDENDRPPPRRTGHEIGQDLVTLSVADLDERLVLLRGEIDRLEEARRRKLASQEAAEAFFKR
ncbi:DUF1192 domain-containing protein [Methylobacterium oryzihabitans]|uniref:DUF1192 domain-containing protein n=1 Tax=Methylobacterium oryzihabitans TaxID=2499852 RepID=A0A3S2VBE7_9HYPH|nr:DUF1192 domain-containing protein [Methylobacterium oryzihabitans]RVU18767.1 DUF1192 domain-containing protein [Methylobacterium oryzihabitans]